MGYAGNTERIILLNLIKTCVLEAKLGYLVLGYQTVVLRSDLDIIKA